MMIMSARQNALGQIRSVLPGDSRHHLSSQRQRLASHTTSSCKTSPLSKCRACGSPNTFYCCTHYSQVTSTDHHDATMYAQMCVCCSTPAPPLQESYTGNYTRNAPSASPFKSDSDGSGSASSMTSCVIFTSRTVPSVDFAPSLSSWSCPYSCSTSDAESWKRRGTCSRKQAVRRSV